MTKRVFVLAHDTARGRAIDAVRCAPSGFVVTVEEQKRTLVANAKMWAMLHELSEQTDWHGSKLNPDEWKDLLSAGLVQSKVVPNLTGNGFVILGQRTSKLSKAEFAALIELIYAFGTERGVVFSDSAPERTAA